MQFKTELIEQILAGNKTQTRRPVKEDETLGFIDDGVSIERGVFNQETDRVRWKTGNTYAVQPGRGKAAVARIKLLNIRREDVRNISDEDAIAEGFPTRNAPYWFLKTWCEFYDKTGWKLFTKYDAWAFDFITLLSRPAHLYEAWVLEFELVED